MIYVVAHVAVRQRIKVKPTHVLFATGYTLVLTLAFYFFGGHVLRLIAFMLMMLIIKMVTKRRNIIDLAIVFAISSALIVVMSFLVGALVLQANTQLTLEFPLDFLVGRV